MEGREGKFVWWICIVNEGFKLIVYKEDRVVERIREGKE